jgi:hypothetical protein
MTPGGEGELDLLVAVRLAGLTTRDVWVRYLALGGNADEVAVEAQVHGLLDLPRGEYNVLAHTLNEELDDLPGGDRIGRVPYQRVEVEGHLHRG